jgi:hypothetical protein
MQVPLAHSCVVLQSWHWLPVPQRGAAAGQEPAWQAVVRVEFERLYDPQHDSPVAQSTCEAQWNVASFLPQVAVAPLRQIAASRPPSDGTQTVHSRGSHAFESLQAAAAEPPSRPELGAASRPAPPLDEGEPLELVAPEVPTPVLVLVPEEEPAPGSLPRSAVPPSSPAGEPP